MIGESLKEKLKISCHKNPIQNVIIDWLLNGNVHEKTLIDSINNSNISDEEFNKITEYLESLDDNKDSDKSNKTGSAENKTEDEHRDKNRNMANMDGNLILNIKPTITSV